eukprot:COSAG01_NODE_3_length_63519_cov_1591.007663_29_plen_428_part_00
MKVKEAKRKENTVSLKVEVSPEEVSNKIQPAFKKIARDKVVPGFRKGKANFESYVKYYGLGDITQEATLAAINDAYLEAIKKEDLDIVDYPQNVEIGEFKEDKPLSFSCNVDVKPIIKLGKYKGLKAKKDLKKVDEKIVDDEVKKLQENAAKYEVVDREIKDADLVTADIEAKEGDTLFEAWSKENTALQVGQGFYGEDLDKALIGLKKDAEKSIEITYPKDFKNPQVAEKKLNFKIKIKEIKEKKLPELTDDFIKANSQFKSLPELKDKIEENFTQRFEQEADEALKTTLIDQVLEPIKVSIPEGLMKQEREQELQQYARILQQSGMKLEQYLEATGKSKEDILKDMEPTIEKRVKTELVLEQLAKNEKIEANENDQLEEIKKANPKANSDEEAKKILKKLDTDRLNFHIRQMKAIKFLIDNAKIA